MAGKNDNLVPVSAGQPFQRRFQPLIIVEGEAVIENQRHGVRAVLDQLRGGQAHRQINLVHGAAADLLDGNQPGGSVHKYIQVLVNAHAAVNPAGDAGNQPALLHKYQKQPHRRQPDQKS